MRVGWWRRGELRCGEVARVLQSYLDGELDALVARRVTPHLEVCRRCGPSAETYVAIKGSLQRLADVEPPALAAVRLRRWATTLDGNGEAASLRLGGGGRLIAPRVPRRLGPLVGAAAALAVAVGLVLHQTTPSSDPRAVAALLELARLDHPGSEGRSGRGPEQRGGHLELGDQTVSLVRRIVDGREVLIATSDRAFSMPADARPASRERDAPWLARRGDLGIVCLSRPVHMLVVGALPFERLVEIGRHLGPP